ncbi:hypothetical protein C475_14068 [Halosimplex carlsbadense 2-9-1]|uniref:Uncharacterized protein n=1 Tax=Halosimplex carlsbadense 2-9-1 TaxID=797114 RepID=M0CM82_9EURY|nr:hypothetical protein [Halosimplex carlsbadense]ELZ23743.1 hypothetical protein C475_14068 [Halosimplex carlsbadense 2-9-1]
METTDESAEGGRSSVDADDRAAERDFEERPGIAAHSATETRTVLTEADNCDGWIATDLTVEPRQ